MKQHLLKIFLLTAFIFAAVHSTTFAAGLTEPLEIVNETGQPILSLYAVPVQKVGWGNDLVGHGVMNQGDKRSIHYDTAFARYKVKVEFENGSTLTFPDIDLINVWRLSIGNGKYDINTRG